MSSSSLLDATKLDGTTGSLLNGDLTACVGWHAEAIQTAQNIGLKTAVVNMPSGYFDRLYVTGEPAKVRTFLSFPQLRRNPCGALFSPNRSMPKWTTA